MTLKNKGTIIFFVYGFEGAGNGFIKTQNLQIIKLGGNIRITP